MLIHKDWVFVANPRTASRSIEQMIVAILGDEVVCTKLHHPKTGHPALKLGLPIYGTVRDPLDQLVSWMHHCGKCSMREFLNDLPNSWLLKDKLTIYASYMTHALRFENGVTSAVNIITGHDWGYLHEEPWIGATGSSRSLWTPELIALAKQKFPNDFMLHKTVNCN